MENFYIVVVLILVLLAIANLIVGISNDAVNFLNSAIGSKVAPIKTILIIASIGILVGVIFSGGMMDVAKNGIFNPSCFSFEEIMAIFLAVMLSDVLLLDFFNTFGLPTSTTVSLIFGLLGASIGVILYVHMGNDWSFIKGFINTVKLSSILRGIAVSIVVAFILGTVIQFIARLIFSFDYQQNYRKYGSIFGSIVITSILFFILVRGSVNFVFVSPELLSWIEQHKFWILSINLIFWTLLFESLIIKLNANVFRFIVLVGTFALAMAFAGNDLVNFIGAPLGGLESYKMYLKSNGSSFISMDFLNYSIKTPILILIGSGFILIITMFISKKSRTVTSTEINLSRKGTSHEKFGASALSSIIVKFSAHVKTLLKPLMPKRFQSLVLARITNKNQLPDLPAFDLIRASVNLFVSSILIAFGTSLKLPLSTTYVTFMVAMGTALADGAWTKENATYRVSGVITIIGGWLLTALAAFVLALIIVVIILWGKIVAIIVLSVLAITLFVRFYFIHNENVKKEKFHAFARNNPKRDNAISKATDKTASVLMDVSKYYILAIDCLTSADRRKIRKLKLNFNEYYSIYEHKHELFIESITRQIELNEDISSKFIQSSEIQLQAVNMLNALVKNIAEFIDAGHVLTQTQIEDLNHLSEEKSQFINYILHYIKNLKNLEINDLSSKKELLVYLIEKLQKKTLKQLKNEEITTKNSLLVLHILSNTENILFHLIKSVQKESPIY